MKDNNNLLIGIIIAVVVFLILGMSGFGGMMGGYGGFFGGFFMLAYSTIFLVLGVLAIIWFWQHIDKK